MDIVSLIDKCLVWDDDAWMELFTLYAPRVLRLCRENRLSSEEAHDILGAVNIKIFENLSGLKEKHKFLAFARTTALHEIRHLQRAEKIHRGLEDIVRDRNYPDPPQNPEENLDKEHQIKLISMALRSLPERCRDLIKMLFYCEEELSLAQIAKMTGRQEPSVRESLKRCIKRLRIILKKVTDDENLLY